MQINQFLPLTPKMVETIVKKRGISIVSGLLTQYSGTLDIRLEKKQAAASIIAEVPYPGWAAKKINVLRNL